MKRYVPTIAALALLACEGEGQRTDPLREEYALSRLSLDPITEIGDLIAADAELAPSFGIRFGDANCDARFPILVQLDAVRAGTRASGTLSMVVGVLDSGSPCDGTGVFLVGGGVVDGEPLVQGPLFIEGSTAEARLPLALIDPELSFLPTWWRVLARRRQGGDAFTDAEAQALWRPPHLSRVESPRTPGISFLDDLVGLGAQPDLDLDRDGLETLLDTDGDGRVDRCVDGDGTVLEGAECPRDGRIADAYELVIRFRLVPVELAE